MGLKEKAKDFLQKQLGAMVEGLTEDLKVKSFGGLKIEVSDCEIMLPSIHITSDGFKIKIVDKSNGEAISDIPIPIDMKITLPIIKIMEKQTINLKPEIDILLKPTK